MSKSIKFEKNDKWKREESNSLGDSSNDDVILTGDYTEVYKDLLIGLRLFRPGNLAFSVIYFSWRSIEFDSTAVSGSDYFAGPCIGMMGKIGGGDKGCCGLGGSNVGNLPIALFLDYGFYGGLLKLKKSATQYSQPPTGFSFGGELGFGIILRKIGLYTLFNYNLDAFAFTQSTTIDTYNYEESNIFINHGFEIRVGYTFDMQVLFH